MTSTSWQDATSRIIVVAVVGLIRRLHDFIGAGREHVKGSRRLVLVLIPFLLLSQVSCDKQPVIDALAPPKMLGINVVEAVVDACTRVSVEADDLPAKATPKRVASLSDLVAGNCS